MMTKVRFWLCNFGGVSLVFKYYNVNDVVKISLPIETHQVQSGLWELQNRLHTLGEEDQGSRKLVSVTNKNQTLNNNLPSSFIKSSYLFVQQVTLDRLWHPISFSWGGCMVWTWSSLRSCLALWFCQRFVFFFFFFFLTVHTNRCNLIWKHFLGLHVYFNLHSFPWCLDSHGSSIRLHSQENCPQRRTVHSHGLRSALWL